MWNFILAILIGAAIPLITLWLQSKEKRKYFELERKEKFKLVAIDRRIETHQQVFLRWHKLLSVIHKSDDDEVKNDILNECSTFWKNNALYLEKNTREGFRRAVNIVSFYTTHLEIAKEESEKSAKEKAKQIYMDDWNYFMNLFNVIQQEVALEPIKPEEDKTPEGEEIKKEIKK